MWDLTSPARQEAIKIVPDRVFYAYGGPLVFTAFFGCSEAFFVKFDEYEDTELYLAVQVDENTAAFIEGGRLSVLSAFNTDFIWVIEAKSLLTKRYWTTTRREIPLEFFPQKNIAIHSKYGVVPNSIAQLNSFFSVDFDGDNLLKDAMRFGLFKQLVDNTYEATRNILSPILLLGSKSVTFDFDISEPAFGSLVLSINKPTVNRTLVERKIKTSNLDISDVQMQFLAQRDNFFDEMGELVSHAENNTISDALIEERFALLDRIQPIIPTEDNQIASVMFSAHRDSKYAHVFVTEKAGNTISRAFKQAEERPVEEFGTMEVSNDPSRSFVLMSRRGKQVTCYVGFDSYELLKRDPRFRNGVKLKIRGRLTRRSRRDILHSDVPPTIMD